jgi:hypothetical protein
MQEGAARSPAEAAPAAEARARRPAAYRCQWGGAPGRPAAVTAPGPRRPPTRTEALDETRLPDTALHHACPWTVGQVLDA